MNEVKKRAVSVDATSYLFDLRLIRSRLQHYASSGGFVDPSDLEHAASVLNAVVEEIENGIPKELRRESSA